MTFNKARSVAHDNNEAKRSYNSISQNLEEYFWTGGGLVDMGCVKQWKDFSSLSKMQPMACVRKLGLQSQHLLASKYRNMYLEIY